MMAAASGARGERRQQAVEEPGVMGGSTTTDGAAPSQASTRSISWGTVSGAGKSPALVTSRVKASRAIHAKATVPSPDRASSSQRLDRS